MQTERRTKQIRRFFRFPIICCKVLLRTAITGTPQRVEMIPPKTCDNQPEFCGHHRSLGKRCTSRSKITYQKPNKNM